MSLPVCERCKRRFRGHGNTKKCPTCKDKKSIKDTIKEYRNNARLDYAIAALWKRMAKDWEAKADELEKPTK